MAVPQLTTAEVEKAIKDIKMNGVPSRKKSTKYDLVINGEKYPPRYVVSKTLEIAGRLNEYNNEPSSDESMVALQRLGLKIFDKNGNPAPKFGVSDNTDSNQNVAVTTQNTTALKNDSQSEYVSGYVRKLLDSKNIIFRGAPGTGKSYLAKEIATYLITEGKSIEYSELSKDQKEQVEFVQFHPSYDYSDFVEGLRPKINGDGSMNFELRDGIFKIFVEKARRNYENSHKEDADIAKELSVQDAMTRFFENIQYDGENETNTFETIQGNKFIIENVDDKHIDVYIPKNKISQKLVLNLEEIRKMLESEVDFSQVKQITEFFKKANATQAYSYDLIIYQKIRELQNRTVNATQIKREEEKKYIFIIDEINRGEISKIFGELFFSIDPGYRGKAGEISTQYSAMHEDPTEKFYIPENLYIIGTMNDIDRSVDSFDFAMRRRFRFIEIRADENVAMLDSLGPLKMKEAIAKMSSLNSEIINTPDLNENYQIGAAYFLKLKDISFNQLWTDYLKPLLEEYIRGMNDEKELMKKFENAYGYPEDEVNGAATSSQG